MRTNLIKPKNISEAKSKTSNDGMLDMVIAFDTTGPMAGCIRSVKEYVTELVPKLFAVNPNFSLSQEMANTGVWIWTLRRLKRIQERGW